MAELGTVVALIKSMGGASEAEVEELRSAITPVENSTASGVDFDLADENGNVLDRKSVV